MRPDKDSPAEVMLVKLRVRRKEHPALFADLIGIPTGTGRRIRLIGLLSTALAIEQGGLASPRYAAPTKAMPLMSNEEQFAPEQELNRLPIAEGDVGELEGFHS